MSFDSPTGAPAIEAATLLQLQGQAFGDRAGHHAGRLKALADSEHGGHVGFIRTESLGDILERRAQVAGFIGLIDQAGTDQAVCRRETGANMHDYPSQMRVNERLLEIEDKGATVSDIAFA